MCSSDLVGLVLQASVLRVGDVDLPAANDGGIFVLDMGEPVKIVDLARQMIRLAGLRPDEDVQIRFTGLRPGEKLFEELLADGEATLATHHPKVRISRASEIPGEAWEQEVIAWVRQPGPVSDETVRSALSRFVPEYSPSPTASASMPTSERDNVIDIGTGQRREIGRAHV